MFSTIGTKLVVAVTGVVLVLFVIGHMLGNLQIYLGPEAINSYAAFLQAKPGPLWAIRLGLLATVLLHIGGIIRLTLANRRARTTAYAIKKPVQSTFASRTMVYSGSVLLAFVVFHLLHLTIGAIDPENFHLTDAAGRHDVYSMTILGFQQPLISISYIIAMGLLGLHLGHGVASIFQSSGLRRPQLVPMIEVIGRIVAVVVVLGNISIPVAALLGWISPTQGRF
ncbi:MAG: succinate dehydrogenase cytochrome b subunit [Acidobacteria bacterium]|nr:succinate dehydrogenase cytochrome b subunit [Acidobacteriota bacterium]